MERSMEPRRAFGRRAMPQQPAPRPIVPEPSQPRPIVPQSPTPQTAIAEPEAKQIFSATPSEPVLSVEDEIEAWKASRGSVAAFPWRQLSLMAGLCFGIASFVLPNTVNDAVQWPLYALTAVSFYVGLHKRKARSA